MGLFNGAGLGTGLALRSDSSLLIRHPSPGETLHTEGIPTCSVLPCSTCQTGLLRACPLWGSTAALALVLLHFCIALAVREAVPLLPLPLAALPTSHHAWPLLLAGVWAPMSDARAMGNMLTSRCVPLAAASLMCGRCLRGGPLAGGPLAGTYPSTSIAAHVCGASHPLCELDPPVTFVSSQPALQLPEHPAAASR